MWKFHAIQTFFWCIRIWFSFFFPLNFLSCWQFPGEMNTFQLSNIGVTTWFHADADPATTSVNVANTPGTSPSAMNPNATKGLHDKKKTKLYFCSPTFPDFFFYFFRIVIQHKISPYLSGFSIFKSIVSFLLKFYMYVPYNVLYWNVCFDIHIVISLTTVNTFCLFSQFKLVYKCYSNNLEFNVISFEQLQTVRQLQFKTEVYS